MKCTSIWFLFFYICSLQKKKKQIARFLVFSMSLHVSFATSFKTSCSSTFQRPLCCCLSACRNSISNKAFVFLICYSSNLPNCHRASSAVKISKAQKGLLVSNLVPKFSSLVSERLWSKLPRNKKKTPSHHGEQLFHLNVISDIKESHFSLMVLFKLCPLLTSKQKNKNIFKSTTAFLKK